MKVNCLGCGQYIVLDESYCDYEGEIKCNACGAMVEVNLSKGKVKSEMLPAQTSCAAMEVNNKREA
jgi:ribosomal protein S27E